MATAPGRPITFGTETMLGGVVVDGAVAVVVGVIVVDETANAASAEEGDCPLRAAAMIAITSASSDSAVASVAFGRRWPRHTWAATTASPRPTTTPMTTPAANSMSSIVPDPTARSDAPERTLGRAERAEYARLAEVAESAAPVGGGSVYACVPSDGCWSS